MNTYMLVNHVAAPAADRDSLSASRHLKPFIALALAVILPSLGRNPRSGRRSMAEASVKPSPCLRDRFSMLPEMPSGISLTRRFQSGGIAGLNLNQGGLHHG
jgi:hypothetical protein